MLERTVRTSVEFQNPFLLAGVDKVLPPGIYEIETVEEAVDCVSTSVYRRVSTTITVQGPTALSRQLTTVDPADLAAALERDKNDAHRKEPA
jgi:hypothetical protein